MSSGQRGESDVVEFVLFYNGDPLIRSTDRLEIEKHKDLLAHHYYGMTADKIEIKRMIGGLRDAT